MGKRPVLRKDGAALAKDTTGRLRQALEPAAQEPGRPLEYLAHSGASQEGRAPELAARDGIREGLVAVFPGGEPCLT